MKKIVIIGAGYSGVLTAKKLSKRLTKNREAEITIIDKNPFHTMLTELHEVAAGRVKEDSIRIDLRKVFEGRKVNVVHDVVESVDFQARKIRCKNSVHEYDYIVIAAGSRPTFFGIPGAEENSFPLWSYEDAVRLKERIENCFRMAAIETDENEKRKLLSFFVIGAGLTGVEMAGELAEYVPILCRLHGIDPGYVSMSTADALERVVPTLPGKLSAKIQKRLEKMGVNVYLGRTVVEVKKDGVRCEYGGSVTLYSAGTIIWVAGIESSRLTQNAAGALAGAGRGRLTTDKYLRSTKDESVYVTGDNIFYIPEGEKAPVPQMVENCEQSAHTAAHNICCSITGEGELEQYRPKFHGVMVSVGGRFGAARVGTAGHMVNLPSFFAMLAKHFINIVYFAQVLGWNKIFSYLKHEFFTIRNRRSFLGGHFSNRTPSFLLVPLRVWLGAVWVFEGVMKIVGGWLRSAQLSGFFGSAESWFSSILSGADVSGGATAAAPNAAAGATAQAASAAGRALINRNVLDIFRIIFVSAKPVSQATLSDYAFKIDIPLLNSFIDKVVLAGTGVQTAMQTIIVAAEILIGLSLIGGLFSTLSSAVSIVLMAMFVTTTGLYLTTFWMFFGAIAVLFGAGTVFGLDYYAAPLLKRLWTRVGWVRRLYIYHD